MMIEFDQLKFGHEATPPINARMTGRDIEIDQLAASLLAHGQIHPLTVKTIDGKHYVADGNRRLAAYAQLVKSKKLKSSAEIACTFITDDQSAHELSLAANELRISLHEADTYLSFKELNKSGMSEDDIALRFGTSKRRVQRMLAIGNLSPVLIDAWRSGSLDTRSIRAFTLSADTVEQERVFNHLLKQGHVHSQAVERQFGAGDFAIRKNINLVTIEKYVLGGGTLTEDLFGDAHIIHNPELLHSLANTRMADEIAELKKAGWAWVALQDDLPHGWKSHWEQLKPKQDKFTTEHKAMSGAVVGRDHNGFLEIIVGVMKPKKAKITPSNATSAPDDKPNLKLSDALNMRLASQATSAVKSVLEKDTHSALAAVLASFLCRHSQPLHISCSNQRNYDVERESFDVLFERFTSLSVWELLERLAMFAGDALFLSHQASKDTGDMRSAFNGSGRALVAVLDKAETYVALRTHFDVEDYFASVSRPLVMAAILEALGDDHVRRVSDLKKPELVKYAVANIPDTGWLPAELRTGSYPGPGGSDE